MDIQTPISMHSSFTRPCDSLWDRPAGALALVTLGASSSGLGLERAVKLSLCGVVYPIDPIVSLALQAEVSGVHTYNLIPI
jgi:hypothetical protein